MTDHGARVLERAQAVHAGRQVADLDLVRLMVEASASGVTQTEIAQRLGYSQPRVSQLIASAEQTAPPPRPGFSGASPTEICQRYAAGQIDRAQVVDELARWPYASGDPGDGYDWLTVVPGQWNDEVVPAWEQGLIDDEIYDEVQHRRDELAR